MDFKGLARRKRIQTDYCVASWKDLVYDPIEQNSVWKERGHDLTHQTSECCACLFQKHMIMLTLQIKIMMKVPDKYCLTQDKNRHESSRRDRHCCRDCRHPELCHRERSK